MANSIYQSFLRNFTPFLEWLPELRSGNVLRADLMAGITVALVLIPQSMAYAQLAGLPPYYGLYAAFLPPMVAAIFGSSRQLQTGPVAVVSLLTAAALEPITTAGSGYYVAYAIMLALMVGVFQLALGLLRLGVLVNFLSHPVVVGFSTAAAIIIATSQLDKIFGVSVEKADHHYQSVWNTVVAASTQTHWPTFAIALLAFAIMLAMRKFLPRLPGVIVAVAVTTLIAWAFHFEQKMTITTSQFASRDLRQQINDQVNMTAELQRFNDEIAEAQAAYAASVRQYGRDDERTRAAQDVLETTKRRSAQRVKTIQGEMKELKKLRFDFVPGDGTKPGRFYRRGNAPEHVQLDGSVWRLDKITGGKEITARAGGNVVGAVPQGLPALRLPVFDLSIIMELAASAITIALIGFMEAISIAKAMATRTRQRLDANQELVGQGLGNIVGSLFQSYPASGSFSRSAVNFGAGAITGFSSIVTGLVVVVVLMWMTPLLYHLPQATLAAVIMMAVIGLINIRAIRHAWRVHRHDGVVAIITFVLTLAFAPHLDNAIMIGVILSLSIYLYRTMKPRVAVLSRHPNGSLADAEYYGLATCDNISVIRFDGSLYFANTSYFDDKIRQRLSEKPHLKFIIVDASGINQMDATGEEVLAALFERVKHAGVEMLFARVKLQVRQVMEKSGFIELVGPGMFFRTVENALEYAWDKLGDAHEASCPLNIVCPVDGRAANPADAATVGKVV